MPIRIDQLQSIDFGDSVDPRGKRVLPTPPGQILLHEFLEPMGITQYRLAKAIAVPQRRIGEIVAGRRAISADTSLRLARFFGLSESYWLGLQTHYDAALARMTLASVLDRITPWQKAAAA